MKRRINMKKVVALFLTLAMTLALLAACGGNSGGAQNNDKQNNGSQNNSAQGGGGSDSEDLPDYELRLASVSVPGNHQTVALEDAAAKILELTDGHVKITVYPNSALGDNSIVYGQVMTGDIDMCLGTIVSTYNPGFDALSLPFLATSYEDYAKVYAPGSFMYDYISGLCAENGVTLLGFFNTGFNGIGAQKLPTEDFKTLNDNSKKDTLLRVPPILAYQRTVEAMNYRTTSIPYADLYSALQSGVADGWIGGSPLVNWDSFRDTISYFIDNRVINENMPLCINAELLASMPEEWQTAITETFNEMAMRVNDERAEQEAKAIQDMKDYGIKVIEPTDEEIEELAGVIREEVWNVMRPELGDDLVDQLCDAYGVAKK